MNELIKDLSWIDKGIRIWEKGIYRVSENREVKNFELVCFGWGNVRVGSKGGYC